MKKYFGLAVGVALMVIAIAAIGMFTHVTQVSASAILDRANQVKNQSLPTQGIQHTRVERYFNEQGLPQDQVAGTIEDVYYDLGSCNSRRVTTNSQTGVVLDVYATDGSHVYGGLNYDINAVGSLTVYRSPIDPAKTNCQKPAQALYGQEMFEQMHIDPQVELLGQQVWTDGRTVYVLRDQPQANTSKNAEVPFTSSQVTLYFDTQTYQYMGSKLEVSDGNGKTWTVKEFRYTVDEILPAGTPVHWDVSDVKGIDIIDDPDGSHRDDGTRG